MPYTYWYAIIRTPAAAAIPPAWGSGLHGGSLRLVSVGDLAAVVSDWGRPTLDRSSEAVDAELVWAHEHVIERVMASCPVLPVRFGTVLAGDERVAAVLRERRAVLLADLARVDGCVELGLRVLWEPPARQSLGEQPDSLVADSRPALQSPGAQYLLRRAVEEQGRQAVRREGEALAQELSRCLRARAVDVRQSVLQTERLLLTAAFLVPRAEVSGFLAAVERLRGQHSQLALLCSGPWPPYHFMSA